MTDRAAKSSPERMSTNQRLILSIAVLASFVAFLDGTIVNVALPAISEELGGGLTTQQWVVDSYLITLGALILVAGSVSDAYGRALVMRIGLIGFAVGGIGLVIGSMLIFWIGVALAPVALVAGAVMTKVGLGGRDHSTDRQVDRGREKAH